MDRLAGLSINLSPSPDDLSALIAKSRQSGTPLSVDVETPREQPGIILLCGVAASPTEAICFDWREPYITLMKELLEDATQEVIGHNFAFDARAFWLASGIAVEARVWDTMAMAGVVWPPVAERKAGETDKKKVQLPFHSLQLCVLRTEEREAAWKQPESAAGQAFYSVAFGHRYQPWEWPRLYCALDVLKTYRLKERLEGMLA